MEQSFAHNDLEDKFLMDEIIKIVNSKSVEEIFQELNNGGEENLRDQINVYDSASDGMVKENQSNESNAFLSLSRKSFASREVLQDSVRKIALEQGYVTVIRKSKSNYYTIIGCDRGGKFRGTIAANKRKKFTGTRIINCPFEIWGKRKGSIWIIEIKDLSHNHESSKNMSGHPMCRKFSKEEMLTIRTLSRAGSAPREILTALRQNNPNLHATARTMYNARARIKKDDLGGRTMIESLLEELGEGGFIYDIERDKNDNLTHLLFIHPSSIVLTKNFPHVFIMDCTYKTNKYNMPLLDIIGVSYFNTSFYSCIVFMQKEEEEDYIWALERFRNFLGIDNSHMVIVTDRELALMNAINLVFPHTRNLLCVWHIQKNVLAKCKRFFKENDDFKKFLSSWTNVIYSTDELSFHAEWSLFEEQYKEKSSATSYIKTNWLPYKEKFVFAWTNKCMHFGNHATSRAEGAHATLKKYLQISMGNLREVKEKICLAIENQIKEAKAELESERIQTSHGFQVPLFYSLLGNVSKHALEQLLNQYELTSSNKVLGDCRCHFKSSVGLPCAHKLRSMLHGRVDIGDIHPQWRIDGRSFESFEGELSCQDDQFDTFLKNFQDKYQKMPLFQKMDTQRQISRLVDASLPFMTQEPDINPRRGHPSGSKRKKNDSSTRRDPCEFEIVERNRACSICGGLGHDSCYCEQRTEIGVVTPPVFFSQPR